MLDALQVATGGQELEVAALPPGPPLILGDGFMAAKGVFQISCVSSYDLRPY